MSEPLLTVGDNPAEILCDLLYCHTRPTGWSMGGHARLAREEPWHCRTLSI
jgi:hypothetical protein